MRVTIITYPVPKNFKKLYDLVKSDYTIVVDQAIDYVIKSGIKIDLMVGDFDSAKIELISENTNKIKFEKEKDYTDTYGALQEAKRLNPQQIILIGGLGGPRWEHHHANLLLFDQFRNLKIITDESVIYKLEIGEHLVEDKGYVSIFGYPEACVTLTGFKYPLESFVFAPFNSMGISNEVENDVGVIKIHSGTALVYLTECD